MRTEEGQGNEEGRQLQRELLALALVEHPLRLTLREAQRALGPAAAIEQAVAALVGDGLLELDGEALAPTRAALRFHQIEPIDPPGG